MKRNRSLALAITALAIAPMAFGADVSILGVTVGPEASFTAVDASTSMTKADTAFGAYTGTTNFTYKIRTTLSGGSGSITVLVTAVLGNRWPGSRGFGLYLHCPCVGISLREQHGGKHEHGQQRCVFRRRRTLRRHR